MIKIYECPGTLIVEYDAIITKHSNFLIIDLQNS